MNGHTLRGKQINNFHFAFPLYVGQLLMERIFLLFFPLEVDLGLKTWKTNFRVDKER